MAYFFAIFATALLMLWAYYFVKTYQLCGYKISSFVRAVLKIDLSFGDKNKLVFTKRIIRFYSLLFLICGGLFFLNYYFIHNALLIILNTLAIFLLLPCFMIVCHYLLLPLEVVIKKYYIFKAKRKIGKNQSLIKIAITGSYGKTSTKNILTEMLEKEYKVCATPKNFNTEMGVCKTILNHLDDHDVLIAEFGARKKGDIEFLTKMINPQYAILTTIGKQHIETFKTLKNIEETKNELPLNMREDGIVVFNGDSLSTLNLFKNCPRRKFLSCDKKGYAYAENIETSESGSSFDLIIDGRTIHAKTKLLGRCNINNIVTASVLASILGISDKDIASAIRSLSPVPHRLELIKNSYCTIIDDAYNSNMVGAKEALDVLSKFKGRRIVVTPGFVEMGSDQSQLNFQLGAMIADHADYIIIMNSVNKNEILSGAISHNFNKKHIYFAETRAKQKEILKLLTCENCVILFENDLPDNYK